MTKNCENAVGQQLGQNEMEGEEVDDGPEKIQVKQKRKKWKHQARLSKIKRQQQMSQF